MERKKKAEDAEAEHQKDTGCSGGQRGGVLKSMIDR
jgi:hypothetical protein